MALSARHVWGSVKSPGDFLFLKSEVFEPGPFAQFPVSKSRKRLLRESNDVSKLGATLMICTGNVVPGVLRGVGLKPKKGVGWSHRKRKPLTAALSDRMLLPESRPMKP